MINFLLHIMKSFTYKRPPCSFSYSEWQSCFTFTCLSCKTSEPTALLTLSTFVNKGGHQRCFHLWSILLYLTVHWLVRYWEHTLFFINIFVVIRLQLPNGTGNSLISTWNGDITPLQRSLPLINEGFKGELRSSILCLLMDQFPWRQSDNPCCQLRQTLVKQGETHTFAF